MTEKTPENLQKLLEKADQNEQIRLKILHNAVISGIQAYQEKSTSDRLKNWKSAEAECERFWGELEVKYFGNRDPKLPNILAVASYLREKGWRISKSTLYNHRDEGKIRPNLQGEYSIKKIDQYAAQHLSKLDGSNPEEEDERLQSEKLHAEIKKATAQAEHWELKTKIASGQCVPKDAFERALAQRAAIFKSDLEAFGRGKATDVVAVAGGDPGRVPDLVEFLLDEFEKILGRYAQSREFKVPLTYIFEEKEEIDAD